MRIVMLLAVMATPSLASARDHESSNTDLTGRPTVTYECAGVTINFEHVSANNTEDLAVICGQVKVELARLYAEQTDADTRAVIVKQLFAAHAKGHVDLSGITPEQFMKMDDGHLAAIVALQSQAEPSLLMETDSYGTTRLATGLAAEYAAGGYYYGASDPWNYANIRGSQDYAMAYLESVAEEPAASNTNGGSDSTVEVSALRKEKAQLEKEVAALKDSKTELKEETDDLSVDVRHPPTCDPSIESCD